MQGSNRRLCLVPWVMGYSERPVDQQRIVAQLGRESVPIVLMPAADAGAFREHYPLVAEAMASRFQTWGTRTIGDRAVTILVARTAGLIPVRAGDGLPCFAGR